VERRSIRNEVLLVLGVSLGYSAIYAMIDIVGRLTASQALNQQQSNLNQSQAPGRPWLDLSYQLASILFGLVPALLALYLVGRSPSPDDDPAPPRSGLDVLGVRPWRVRFDLLWSAALACAIGIPGLLLYVASRQLGMNTEVVPESLPNVWWRIPVLLLSAAQNGLLEEVIVVGYLVTRLCQYGWATWAIILASALLRGSYHLYQGFGGFLGNAVMGIVFVLFYLRVRRVGPLVVAHTLLDSVVFVGYLLFASHLSFLR
jgi:membrane protease YdiL (CAAX protease family)